MRRDCRDLLGVIGGEWGGGGGGLTDRVSAMAADCARVTLHNSSIVLCAEVKTLCLVLSHKQTS